MATVASVPPQVNTLTGAMSNMSINPASAAPTAPFASASLYVGDLQPDVTEALLFEIFNAVGPVQSVRVCRDSTTRRSLGYAYVNFHRVDDAERALDTMNFKNIRNRACRIMWSHRDPSLRKSGLGNIFVKNLAKSIDNKQLYDTFSMFGNILSCKVCVNDKRESLGYGFVHYETDEAAQQAIQRVDGKMISGEKVSVQAFKGAKERGAADKFKYTNVFVKNLAATCTNEELEKFFSTYGTVTSAVVNANKKDEDAALAFGFVNFSTPEEATAAVTGANETEFQGKKLYVARAQKKEHREKELRDRFEAMKAERQKSTVGVNLYVKNLSDDFDDAKLSNEFSKYGQITSASIMRDPAGKSKGFGFVCFSTPEEATKAVTELNGRMIDNKPLYVGLAQRKDSRRQQLEAQYLARSKVGGPGAPAAGMNGFGALGGMGAAGAFASQQAAMQALYANAAAGGQMMGYPGGAGLTPQQRQFMYPGQPMMAMGGPQGGPQQQFRGGFPGAMAQQQQQQMRQQQLNPALAAQQAAAFGGPYGMMNAAMQQQQPQSQAGMRTQPLNMAAAAQQGANMMARQQQQQQANGRPGGPQQPQQAGAAGPRGPAGPMIPQQGGPQGQVRPGMLPQQQQQQIGKMQSGLPPHILQQQQQQVPMRYPNVRGPSTAQQQQAQQSEAVAMPSASEPLTIKALAAAPEEMRKQMIGERLFPLIKAQENNLAGKITGMLLEMDNGELIHLLESPQALQEKIEEALLVLKTHVQDGGETPE